MVAQETLPVVRYFEEKGLVKRVSAESGMDLRHVSATFIHSRSA